MPKIIQVADAPAGTPTGSALLNAAGDVMNASGAPAGGTPAPLAVQRRLSEFYQASDTDDQTLQRFMDYAGAQTFKPEVLFDEARRYTVSADHVLYPGFAMAMGYRPGQDQPRTSKPFPNELYLGGSGVGGFSLPTGETHGCSFRNMVLDGSAASTLIKGHNASPYRVLWTSLFRDISAQNIGCVIGTPNGAKTLLTACTFDGAWNINNIQYRAFNSGGSDTKFAFSQALIDSPGNTFLADSAYLLRWDAMQKSPIQHLYLTADRHSGMECLFSGDLQVVSKSIFEGRNENTPCYGALVRGSGNSVWAFENCFFGYAMTNPAATGRNDGGYIHWVGGSCRIEGGQFKPAAVGLYAGGVIPPLAYFDGGRHIVKSIQVRDATVKPRVVLANGATCESDGTVTVQTV